MQTKLALADRHASGSTGRVCSTMPRSGLVDSTLFGDAQLLRASRR
jgi:hypothetical protein